MSKIIMTKGLPASGKSTWAKDQVAMHDYVRCNKDDLRAMLHDGHWSKQNEKFTVEIRDAIVASALARGKTVIVDDTNFAPVHENQLRRLADLAGAGFEVKDFTGVPLQVCLDRDADRTVGRVGRKVIMDMYEKYLYKKPVPPALVPSVPYAVICDLDGTVAVMTDRGPFDPNVENDVPRAEVMDAVCGLASTQNAKILLVSGRKEEARTSTEEWMKINSTFRHDALFMRQNDDNRRDSIVKREIYDIHIAGKYNVIAVFDDRPQVIRECWRPLGLPVFDVGDGREF